MALAWQTRGAARRAGWLLTPPDAATALAAAQPRPTADPAALAEHSAREPAVQAAAHQREQPASRMALAQCPLRRPAALRAAEPLGRFERRAVPPAAREGSVSALVRTEARARA
jgi:hypothetical protein